jgi:hypothetical protein
MRGIIEPVGPPEPGEAPPRSASRLLWFAGLTLAGTGLTGAVAYGLRWLLRLG